MANTIIRFSTVINGLEQDAKEWAKKVLTIDADSEAGDAQLRRQVYIKSISLADHWPSFGWSFENGNDLCLYSEGGCDFEHVEAFVKALIQKFMPDYVFKLTWSVGCDRLIPGYFGGGWMVVTKDFTKHSDSWDDLNRYISKLQFVQLTTSEGVVLSPPVELEVNLSKSEAIDASNLAGYYAQLLHFHMSERPLSSFDELRAWIRGKNDGQ